MPFLRECGLHIPLDVELRVRNDVESLCSGASADAVVVADVGAGAVVALPSATSLCLEVLAAHPNLPSDVKDTLVHIDARASTLQRELDEARTNLHNAQKKQKYWHEQALVARAQNQQLQADVVFGKTGRTWGKRGGFEVALRRPLAGVRVQKACWLRYRSTPTLGQFVGGSIGPSPPLSQALDLSTKHARRS